MNRRNVIVVSQVATGLLTLLTAVLISVGYISIPILFILGVFQGTFFAFNMPARQALVAELVPQHELMNAIALSNTAMNSTRIVGPALAGLMIAAWGIEAAYYFQAFLLLFVIAFLLRIPAERGRVAFSAQRGSVVKEIGVGLRYIRSSPTLMMLMFMAFVPTILGMPYITLLPGFAVHELHRGAGSYGFMFTVTGMGAIFGSLFIASMTFYRRKPLLQMIAGIGWGISLLLLGVASRQFGYSGALIALATLGLFSTIYQTLNNTMVMANTDEQFYGRVMSVYMLTFSVFPLMAWPMGLVADRIGAFTTFMLLGIGIVGFLAIVFAVNPRYTFMVEGAADEPAPVEAGELAVEPVQRTSTGTGAARS
jgi:MFS family permease